MAPICLGLDIGTSAVKAVLIDEDETALAAATVPLATARPQPGWSEQDPEAWWRAAGEAVARIRAAAPDTFTALGAIGLSGQMHAAVLLGPDDAPLRPAILWNDGRAGAEAEALEAAVPDIGRLVGVRPMPGLTAPKLIWIRAQEPDTFARIATVLSAKDYVRLKLSGEKITDCSDAAGTLWLDEAGRRWSPAVLAACGLTPKQMPALVEGSDPAGQLRPEIARDWGLDPDRPIVIAGGAGDAVAGAVGIGAVEAGDAFISLGTSAQIFVTTDAYRPAPETMVHAFAHALPGRWFQMAALLNGASCVGWAASLLGVHDIDALLVRTENAFSGPQRLLFLPYLTGERTPHNDPDARGVLFGLSPEHGAADVMQAVLEGVGLSLLEGLQCLAEAGTTIAAAAIIGGGARSAFWARLIASILGIPVTRYAGAEAGPALGAARLARLAATGEPVAAVCRKPPVLDMLAPDPALHARYRDSFIRFRRLYRALSEEFRA